MYTPAIVLAFASISQAAAVGPRENNGVGVTPAMGFNNFNANLPSSAVTALTAAKAFISLGLKDLGYQYINMDDSWSANSRSNGKLIGDPNFWPNGIKAVADQLHSMGFKMGLYGDSGTLTCEEHPGSVGHETTDAQTLASWGIDYWKYDNCNTPTDGSSKIRYTTMSNALKATGRQILFSMCTWGEDYVDTWGGTIANSWRVGTDIRPNWAWIAGIISDNYSKVLNGAPGGFNDFDMLEVGNVGLSTAEERAHFGVWAIIKSPLLIGTDLTKIANSSLAILKNKCVISINQDSLGKPASYFTPSGKAKPVAGAVYPYWSGKLSNGYVIGLLAVNGAATLTANFADVPGLGAGPYNWTECYSGTNGTGKSVTAKLNTHDMAIYKVFTTN